MNDDPWTTSPDAVTDLSVAYLVVKTGALMLALPVDSVARLEDEETAEAAEMPGRAGLLIKNEFVPGLTLPGMERSSAAAARTWLILRDAADVVLGALAVDRVVGIERVVDVPAWRERLAALSGGALRGGFLTGGGLCLIPDLDRLSPLVSS